MICRNFHVYLAILRMKTHHWYVGISQSTSAIEICFYWLIDWLNTVLATLAPHMGFGIVRIGPTLFPGWRSILCLSFVFTVYVLFSFLVFWFLYQCSQLPGKTNLQNDPLYVEWDVKPYSLIQSMLITFATSAVVAASWITGGLHKQW